MAWNISNIENWHRNSLSTLITACSPCPKTWSPFEKKPSLFSRFCCGEIGSILWNWDKIQECQVWRPSYTLGDTLQSPFKPLFLKLLLNSRLTNPPHTKSKFFLCLQYIPAHTKKKKEGKKDVGDGLSIISGPLQPQILLSGWRFTVCAADGAAAVAVPLPPTVPTSALGPSEMTPHHSQHPPVIDRLILSFFVVVVVFCLGPSLCDFSTLREVYTDESRSRAVPERGGTHP